MAEYDDVPWAISHFSENIPDRIRMFIETKYSTIERAIEHLQVSSSAMSTYLKGERVQGGVRHESYPGVPFLLKLGMVGCNLHWLLTGDGEMELDPVERIDSARMLKQEYLAVLEKYRLHSPSNLDKALGLVVSLTGLREYLSCDVKIEMKSPLDREATPSAKGHSEEETGKAAAREFNDEQERKRKASTKPGKKSRNANLTR